MTNAQKIIDWLADHPNSLPCEIEKGTKLPYQFTGSYLSYLTKNGTLVRTGEKRTRRYRVAEESDHPPAQSSGIPAADVSIPSNERCVQKPEAVDAVQVEFGYYNTNIETSGNLSEQRVLFWVPTNLLWSSQGLAQLFEITRAAWLNTEDGEHNEEEWGTWHLVTIHENNGDVDHKILSNIDWRAAVAKRAAGKD